MKTTENKAVRANKLKEQGLVIFEVIRGSQAHGTNTPESDEDRSYIYISPLDDLLGFNYVDGFKEDNNDTEVYELGKFLKLLQTGNPTVIETLYSPEDCIIYKHPIMDMILEHRDIFVTKQMKNSFLGYSTAQISKAGGLQKKMNWEEHKKVRKNLLEFVYTNHNQGSQQIKNWLDERGLKQEYCGLSAIPNMRYTYGLYYDYAQHLQREKVSYNEWNKYELDSENFGYVNFHKVVSQFYDFKLKNSEITEIKYNEFLKTEKNLKYKGILQDIETSNAISLSSIPKEEYPSCTIQVNQDGYQQHCKDFREYNVWLKERNTSRYVDIEGHGQKIDGKNMSQCVRLLRMSKEIAEGKGVIVRRPDAEYLLEIRKGKHNLEKLLEECKITLEETGELFKNSNLPENVDKEFVNELIIKMRKQFYGIV